jgi:hypothetical protein
VSSVSKARRPTSDLAREPGYLSRYKNFAVSRSASGVLTLRFHTSGGPHTFGGTTHHDFPRLLEDIAFDKDNRIPFGPTRPAASMVMAPFPHPTSATRSPGERLAAASTAAPND